MSNRSTLLFISLFLIFGVVFAAAPMVIVNSPPNDYFSNSTTVSFNYSVTDDTASTLLCILYVDGNFNASDLSVSNGTTNILTSDFSDGFYSWFVSCVDVAEGLPTDSAPRNLTVNAPPICPTISVAGSYIQLENYTGASNMGGSGNSVCVDINTSNVIYDCGGFSIVNNGTLFSNGIEIESDLDNVTIQNCNVKDYSYSGIYVNSLNSNISILNNSFNESSAIGVLLSNTTNSTISGNIFENTLIALELVNSTNIIIQNNSFNFGSVFSSLAIVLSGSSSNVIDNVVVSSYLKALILDEDIYGNPSSNNNITNSNFSSSAIGIHILSGVDNLLVNNTLDHNSAAGLFIQSSSNQVVNSTISNSDSYGAKITGNGTTLNSIHYFNNSGGDLIVAGSFTNDTQISVINNIFDSPLGNYVNYTNISYVSTALAATDYLLSWASAPAALPSSAVSMNGSYLNFTSPVSVDPSSFTNLSWFFPLGATDTSNAQILHYNGSDWSDFTSFLVSDHVQTNSSINTSGIYVLVSVEPTSSPPPFSSGGSSSSNPRLSLSLDMQCTNNTITTNVGSVSVSVVDEESGSSIYSGLTNDEGDAIFNACGRSVRVYASKSGYRPIDDVFTLDSCSCTGSREGLPVISPPTLSPTPSQNTTVSPRNDTLVVPTTASEPTPVVLPTFAGPTSGAVGSSVILVITSCDGCSVRVESPDGMSSTLSVSSGQVSLPVTMAGNYRLSLLRNGEAVKTLSVAATSPTPSPAPEPTTAPPIPSESGDNGIGGMLMILVVLVIIGGVAYYFMNQRK